MTIISVPSTKTYHVDKPDDTMQQILKSTFPSYHGKKFKLSSCVPSRLDSYWDGGSKDSFCFYHLDQQKAFDIHSNHPAFEPTKPRDLEKLPDRVVLVKHTIFCGKDLGITFYANQNDLVKMLPKKSDVSENEKIVLKYTAHLKNSYGGETNIRFKEASRDTGISQQDWFDCQKSLIDKKLLRKNGSITPNGRNSY